MILFCSFGERLVGVSKVTPSTTLFLPDVRIMNEQTEMDDDGKREAKEKKDISPSSLQNPSDPVTTFRTKAGKAHKGYVGNFVETIDESGESLITDFDLQPNIHSDSGFCKEQLEKHSADDSTETIIADGAYGGYENQKLAEEHNVGLVATAIIGKIPDPIFSVSRLAGMVKRFRVAQKETVHNTAHSMKKAICSVSLWTKSAARIAPTEIIAVSRSRRATLW